MYKKDTIENLKMFSDLKTQEEYSNCSKELNSLFKEFTFSFFYNNLKNYNDKLKSININSFYSISSNQKKSKSRNYKEFDISKIKTAIEKMKKKENILKIKREHPYTERSSYSNPIYTLLKNKIKKRKEEEIKIKKKDNNKILSTPEVGRYNPLYETINRHTYEALFSFKNYKEYNNFKRKKNTKLNKNIFDDKNNSNNKIRNKTISAFNFEEKNNFLTDREESKEKKEKQKLSSNIFYNTAVSKKNKKLFKERNFNENNHCLKFETYTSRKPLINKIFYKTDYNSKISSFFSPKNAKGSVEFNKVSSNKYDKDYFEKLIIQKRDIPSLGFYRPNYSFVNDKAKNIFFNGRKKEKNIIKFMKLKKILGRYYVRDEYELFDLLNNHTEESSKDNFK